MHVLAPAAEYVPAMHALQLSEDEAAEEPEYFPAAQFTQDSEALTVLKVPAAQLVQLEDPEVAA